VIWKITKCGSIFVALASIGFWSDAKTSIMPMMYNIGNYGKGQIIGLQRSSILKNIEI
jgi:hypothetical protein